MTLSHYEVFVTVIERGSLVSAAEQLNLTPSAISHALATLERNLGFSILVRSRTGVQITANGQKVLPLIREVLQANERLSQHVMNLNGLETGTITIGAFSSVIIAWLPNMVKEFRQMHPNITVCIEQGGYGDVERWVAGNKVDIGFVSMIEDATLQLTPLYRDPLMCIAPHDYPSKDSITVAELAEQNIIVQRDGYDQDTQNLLIKHQLVAKSVAKAIDDAAILALVESGIGLSVMPELAVRCNQNDVKIIPFKPSEERIIALASLGFDTLSPAAQAMYNHIVRSLNADRYSET